MSILKIRKPAVAGKFYPSGKQELRELIHEIYRKEKPKIDVSFSSKDFYGGVVPHAGYIFSAYQAVHFFELLKQSPVTFDIIVIINPNHTGYGERISLDSHEIWSTPFGDIEQDMEFLKSLEIPFSNIAHEMEHSGEVMLPFLQYFVPYEFKIAMITLSQQNLEQAKILAKKIKDSTEKLNRKIAIIASSDFTHFKNPQQGSMLDDMVLEQIKNQDIVKLYKTVNDYQISVCGYGPIMSLMEYSHLHGKYSSDILARGHSGQIMPSDKVVDYISIVFYKSE